MRARAAASRRKRSQCPIIATTEAVMPESRFIAASDGLQLHALDFGSPRAPSPRLPVVCLPGLSRTAEDFTTLATALAKDRRVLALDLRGRGRSGYDRDPKNYTIAVETDDVITVMTALAVGPAVFVGTSRGGFVTMTLATRRPDLIAGVVLNDIGPVVDTAGVMRIKSYVGKLHVPATYQEGADMLRGISDNQFPNLTNDEWLAAAKRAWRDEGGRLVATYDPALTHTLETVSPDKPFPTLWREFEAIPQVPLMVVHGANSDILSGATVAAMRKHRPDMEVVVVPDQGHAPLLSDARTIGAIASFAARCDAVRAKQEQ
jgi:pimeloyl-ACP methyl ester carboxylesterase